MKLLSNYFSEDIEAFKKDLFLLMNIVYHLDVQYGSAHDEFDHYFKKFEKFVYDWNLKYKHLIIRIYKKGIRFTVKILVNEQDLKKVLLDAIINIYEIKQINGKPISVNFLTEKHLRRELKSLSKKLDVVYLKNGNENSLTLEYDDVYDRIRLVYAKDDMLDETSPEFVICAYYALKQVDKNINLQKYSGDFGFDTDILSWKGRGDGPDRRLPDECYEAELLEY